ncbi:MAG: septum formation protein Maf [Alphaproteobacteria bacterium]|nr:septum formation protein Maf [Alphaproteobacteria bacterium]
MTDKPPLLLASASPRRRALLSGAGITIAGIVPADIDETPLPDEDPVVFALRMAREKAAAIHRPGHWVLAADTVVHVGGEIMGKPLDDGDALRMLTALAGVEHLVTTGWCLRWCGPGTAPGSAPVEQADQVSTRVRMRAMTTDDLRRYIATGEGVDKAGSYAIQGHGMVLVEHIEGSYTNVVGLPLTPVLQALARAGVPPDPFPSPEPA